MNELTAITQIHELIERGAIFYVSHSAGKDSQAMYALLSQLIPSDQIVVVHADLGEVEHHGVQDHIVATIEHELQVVRAKKTLFDMVERRFDTRPDAPSWPSSVEVHSQTLPARSWTPSGVRPRVVPTGAAPASDL